MQDTIQPLVSVAIITYNQKEFLKECINSVLNQTYKNIEIVIADDASTDGTRDLLNDYKNRYPGKFKLIFSEINEGITANSNKAHFGCDGKYIAWIGGDDLMYPDKIEKQVDFLETHNDFNIVYHNLEVFESTSGRIIKLFNGRRDKHIGGIELLIKYGTFNGACSTMVRRAVTPSYGFDHELKVASDWFYWIETLRYGGQIGYIDEILGSYRRHANNVTNQNSSFITQGINDHFMTLKKVQSFEKDYSKEIKFRLSNLYSIVRMNDYCKMLTCSLENNILNFKSWIYLIVYLLSFKKVKL